MLRSAASTRHVPIRAIDRGGALTLNDGSIVRALELTPLGALAASSELGDDVLDGLADLLGELAPGEGLQWHVDSRPVERDELGEPLGGDPPPPLARLATEDAERVRRQATDPATVERTVHAIVRHAPANGRGARLARAGAAPGPLASSHARLLEQSLERVERLRARLATLGLRPRLVDGPGMSGLLLRRLRGVAAPSAEPRVEVVGSFDARAEAQLGIAAAERLLTLLSDAPPDFEDERRVRLGGQLEQTIAVGAVPSAGVRDWLAPLLTARRPSVLSIHVRAREDGMLDLSAFQCVREPGPRPDPVRLATVVDGIVRDAMAASGVRMDRGEFVQQALWPATLPLGLDVVEGAHRVDVRVAAGALPLFADGCGSPSGVPFGRAPHGHVERLDPWDLAHRHAGVLVAGGSARERRETALALIARLAARGAAVVALDAEGELGAACERLGDAARVVTARTPAELGDLATAPAAPPVLALDASDAEALLPLAGAAAALLADGAGVLRGHLSGPAAPGAGALVLLGAERLLREPGGALWLRRAAACARRDGCCVVLLGVELAPFDAAELLGVLPVRVLLSHPPRTAAALGERLALAPAEARAFGREPGAPAGDPTALWLNGDRGRAIVRILDLPPAEAAQAA